MKRLTHIISERKMPHAASFQIVYEWEDIISRELKIPVVSYGKIYHKFQRLVEKTKMVNIYHHITRHSDIGLQYVMAANIEPKCDNSPNIIPVIIDFWLDDSLIKAFIQSYRNVPLMLVTNREVYDLLLSYPSPFPIEHWPLSYPDQYIENCAEYEKKYDFCLFGRPNPFFVRFLKLYEENHKGFSFIQNNGNINNRQYVNSRGEIVSRDTGRASYLNMIKQTRVSCYTTPGIDESKKETGRYNQVTPRLFELLGNGCQVIGHYPDTADTKWYELSEMVPNVNSYAEFDNILTSMLSSSIDIRKTKSFLMKHSTINRVAMLNEILEKHKIIVG